MNVNKQRPLIFHDAHYNLIRSKKNWIEFFKLAKIPFEDIDLEFDINYLNETMPDFYFPEIDLGDGFGKTQDFFGVLNYRPQDFYSPNAYYISDNLLSPINKHLKYIKFLVKNKKPIVFLKNTLDFIPTTIFMPPSGNGKFYFSTICIPFAYLANKKNGTMWWAGGDEDFNTSDPYKTIKDKIIE